MARLEICQRTRDQAPPDLVLVVEEPHEDREVGRVRRPLSGGLERDRVGVEIDDDRNQPGA